MFDNAKQDLQRSKGTLSFRSFRPSFLTSESKLRKITPPHYAGRVRTSPAFAFLLMHKMSSPQWHCVVLNGRVIFRGTLKACHKVRKSQNLSFRDCYVFYDLGKFAIGEAV